ncbi:MAG: malonyl-CoA decarboxylase family protein [Burkholderiaceae bacterium]
MFERFLKARKVARERQDLTRLIDDCRQLLTQRGESNSIAIAARAIGNYRGLAPESRAAFFDVLAAEFDPDPGELLMLAERYATTRSPENLIALARAAEPPRQELLRRLNLAPEGTATIVAMRAALLARLREDERLRAVDADFQHLLSSWFNPGFLHLVKVDWRSPAYLLEKIIHYESVHEIQGWSDLRRRLEPDRRCFAFEHPMLPDEPLIFVEVALLPEMPGAIAPLLEAPVAPDDEAGRFRVAVFYSISNCQPGLRGVSLGNFLIKRVAQHLKAEFPQLKTFCTLSPIPSLVGWLRRTESISDDRLKPAQGQALNQALAALRASHGEDLGGLLDSVAEASGASAPVENGEEPADSGAPSLLDVLRPARVDPDDAALQRLSAYYLWQSSAAGDRPSDPVARFHLNNGARLERLNLRADRSAKGVRQSAGMMVNYLYDLDEIEGNHEKFVNGEVAASRAVMSSF